MIYFDNAATSWPKPPGVLEAMTEFMVNVGANPGRSGHRQSVEAGRIVYEARERVAELFNAEDPMRVIFGLNATDGLNLGIRGLLRKGDHVITTSMEHNSVMRPLRELETSGIELSILQCSKDGMLDPSQVETAVRVNTRLIVVNHASNIIGTVLPIREIGAIAREKGIHFMIDAAQTGGNFPVDMEKDNVDLIAFTGHKGLLGPQGTGGLVIGEHVETSDILPQRAGGTGSRSEFEVQPDFLPDKYESGTMNTVGLAGLAEGVRFVLRESVSVIHEKERSIADRFITGAEGIPGMMLYGGREGMERTPVVSFNIQGLSQSEAGLLLDEEYDIMSRVGLHCSPSAHRTIGTYPHGTIRFGMGYFNTEKDVDIALSALREIADHHEAS